ncbi:MAG: 4-hydroxythreonine-4-phosphate dehydrogenase [bacterium ADurb.Bin374]|nr:MAG: 4-hydroxythreonine-4-phosphate dehydrogenase [bacterium ADurb.Bin374]
MRPPETKDARRRTFPMLALTLGDPCGIGPEIVAKALPALPVSLLDRLVVVGPRAAIEAAHRASRIPLPEWIPVHSDGSFDPAASGVKLLDTGQAGPFRAGAICPEGGEAAVAAIEAAHDLCDAGIFAGMVTGPIGKEAIRLAGSRFSGHTDMLCALAGVADTRMAMVWGRFRVAMTTLHVAWRDVPALLTADSVYETIRLAHEAAVTKRVPYPCIRVAGLNPHAGEHGLFGDEEQKTILPAIKRIRRVNPNVEGPIPADSLFKAEYRRTTDYFVAQTHDQGLIAIKALGGIRCVNVTLGLPYVRTSVGHGTAYDIAGRGIADHRGLIAAIREAVRLTKSEGIRAQSSRENKKR